MKNNLIIYIINNKYNMKFIAYAALFAASVSAQNMFDEHKGDKTKMLGENGHGQRSRHNRGAKTNDAFMNAMDENHDGELTKTELKYGFDKMADKIRDQIKASHEAFVDEAFAKYDGNAD